MPTVCSLDPRPGSASPIRAHCTSPNGAYDGAHTHAKRATATYNPKVHHRRSIRLRNRDYRRGTYFVTICTYQRECTFGAVDAGQMRLNEAGSTVVDCWRALGEHELVMLDEFVLMPNHLHAIITLGQRLPNGAPGDPCPHTLGQLLGAFKATSTRRLMEGGLAAELPRAQRQAEHRPDANPPLHCLQPRELAHRRGESRPRRR